MADGFILEEDTWLLLRDLLRHWKRYGAWKPAEGSVGGLLTPREPAFMQNDSGESIPAYACCQVTGTVEQGGQNYLVVDKPADTTGDAGWYVFNGHAAIADGEEGRYQTGPIVRAYKNSGTVTAGDAWGPTSGQWYLTSGSGPFIAAGADDIGSNVFKVFTGSGGGGPTLYRFTLNASLASGTADADILEMDGTDTGLDEDVLDPLGIFSSLTSVGDAGLCLLQNGSYYVIQAVCP